MEQLKRRIRQDGQVLPGGVLKVDGFLNHQMDPALFTAMARQFYTLYGGEGVNKILTIEASGIGLACITGQVFGCPVLFAKKGRPRNMAVEVYTAEVASYTRGGVMAATVAKEYLTAADRVLVVDDFLANGAALGALIALIGQAGAAFVGAAIGIEKAFQGGGARLRAQGYRVEALARIQAMGPGGAIELL